MEALIDGGDSIAALRSRPRLYDNMLGNRDSVLWIVDDAGQVLIAVNPTNLLRLPANARMQLGAFTENQSMRLAWIRVERAQMLDRHRLKKSAGKWLIRPTVSDL